MVDIQHPVTQQDLLHCLEEGNSRYPLLVLMINNSSHLTTTHLHPLSLRLQAFITLLLQRLLLVAKDIHQVGYFDIEGFESCLNKELIDNYL